MLHYNSANLCTVASTVKAKPSQTLGIAVDVVVVPAR